MAFSLLLSPHFLSRSSSIIYLVNYRPQKSLLSITQKKKKKSEELLFSCYFFFLHLNLWN